MFSSNINLKANTLKVLAIITSLIGVIFILAANRIGSFAIRFAMVITIIIFIINIKMTFHYSGKLKKATDILFLIGATVVFIFPELVVFIIGIALISLSGISLFQMIKSSDYDDKIKLAASITGIIFSIFCIFNAQGTLVLVIRLIGAILIAIGCVCFYQFIIKSRQRKEQNGEQNDDHKFQSAEEIQEIIEVEEMTDIEEEE